MINSKEHYDLMDQFEKGFYYLRLDKEERKLWQNGIIYQNGETNNLFKAYREGYALGKVVERDEV